MSRVLSRFQVAALTHQGAVRKQNEDGLAIDGTVLGGNMSSPVLRKLSGDGPHVLMVADGMGGHAHGEIASRVALEALLAEPSSFKSQAACSKALLSVNDRIYDLMQERPEVCGMGTTIAGVAIKTRSVIRFNVGDSRIYRHRFGRLARLSQDDVPFAVPKTARRTSHGITQSLGGRITRTLIAPHVAVAPALQPNEAVLLCSDGLTDMMEEDEILHVLDNVPNPDACVRALFDLALSAGGQDNISVIVARAE
jgi:serine/threonine protein phosphatase PrpC